MYTPQRFPLHLQCVAALPSGSQKSKNYTYFDSILNKLLTCYCGHFKDLIQHLTVVRQTVSRLLTLSD